MRITYILFHFGLAMLLLGCPETDDADDDSAGDDDAADDDAADDDTGDPTGGTCAEILANAPGSASGVYTLTLSDQSTVEVYCDMSEGWTLAFVSNSTATDKLRFSQFLAGTGVGSLSDNNTQYALANYTSLYHQAGIEIRLTWLCGQDLGAADVTADPSALNSGNAVWSDDRSGDDLIASDGSFHNSFSDLSWTGDTCWSGSVREDYLYGFGIGNGNDYGQYVGWFSCADCYSGDTVSTAISDGAMDNVTGTVAGWIR